MLKKTCLLVNSVTDSCKFVFLMLLTTFSSSVGIANLLLINYNLISSWHGNLPR